ncbi:thioesterase II family protein [Pseudonocardia spinosispora]|uniref:thioesterase II family protein n=1 Tax=Pseudonocardia spinosispora TaxID=103441 RepID=UPI00146FC3F4|nr:alpha/beta fold hydrolase [Pseudonocardia spinosispora]
MNVHRLPHDRPPLQLLCFPWSGASSSAYEPLAEAMPAHVRVVGVRPPKLPDIDSMADVLADELDLAGRYAFFGHSFGALLAYAVARRLPVPPELIVTSGSRSPATPPPVTMHELPDDEFDTKLGRMGGIAPAYLADPAFMDRFRPKVRADLSICESYRASTLDTLDVPMSTWAGSDDWYASPWLTRPWGDFAAGHFQHRIFDGGHFFINDTARSVRALLADLRWAAARPALVSA